MPSTLINNIIAALNAAFNAGGAGGGVGPFSKMPANPIPSGAGADPQGIMSAIYDTIYNTVDAYEAAHRAPMPQSGAGAGHVYNWMSIAGGAFVLPAGGTWWWWGFNWNTSSTLNWSGGISAGGTTVIAGTAGYYTYGTALEILDARGFDDSKPIYKRDDGSYVITAETGQQYHVLTHAQAREQGTRHDALYDELIDWIYFMEPEVLEVA